MKKNAKSAALKDMGKIKEEAYPAFNAAKFSDDLREAMSGIDQVAAAKKANVQRNTIYRVFNHKGLNVETIYRLAKTFNLNLNNYIQ